MVKNLAMEFEGDWPDDVKNNFLKDLNIIENFITDEEEASIIHEIEPYLKRMKYENDHWVII